MCVSLIDGPAAGAEAPESLFADGEGLIVVTTLVPQPGGDAAVRRRLAVYRTTGGSDAQAAFAGWDDEIDRSDDICAELWAGDADLYQPVDGTAPEDGDAGEVVLRLTDREPSLA